MGLGTSYKNLIRLLPTCLTTNTILQQIRHSLNLYNNKFPVLRYLTVKFNLI